MPEDPTHNFAANFAIGVEDDRVGMLAHAKINLALAVDAPIRDDGPTRGMHPIASWMAPIGLADAVEIVRDTRDEHRIEWADGSPVAWPSGSDLAVRAHRAMERATDRDLPARIVVRKAIPAGGGLGGGSSDAAAVLRAMNHLFGIGFDAERLRTIASTLGSDIPFFIPDDPHPATPLSGRLVTGLGGTTEPAPVRCGPTTPGSMPNSSVPKPSMPKPSVSKAAMPGAGPACHFPIVLIVPPFGCPTGDVYRAFDAGLGAVGSRVFHGARVAAMARAGLVQTHELFNDLASAASRVRPALGEVRGAISAGLGCPVHVSGSGSTLFCLGFSADAVRAQLPERSFAMETGVLCSCS